MNRGELIDKLYEWETRANEVVNELDKIKDECNDLYYEIHSLRKELEG